VLALIASATLFFRVGSLPLMGADEPRYARIAQEMSAGREWVTPLLEGRPWLEKPPLYYWMTIPAVRLLGGTETAARIGPALCALAAALALLWLGTRVWGRLEGLLSAGILLTSIGFVAFGRSASTDMPMTACLTIALAVLLGRAVTEAVTFAQLVAGYVFLGLSVLAKGPVSLLLAAGIAGLFWCFEPKVTLRRWHALAGIAITAAVALPWFWLAFRENGFSFVAVFFINHNLARYVSDLHHHAQPFYYYVPVTLGLLFPWTGWLVTVRPRRGGWKRIGLLPRRDPAGFFLALWILVPLVFFSASRSKLPGYILPVIPPLAAVLGVRIAGLIRSGAPRSPLVCWAPLAVSAAFSAALPVVFQKVYGGWQVGALLAAVVFVPALLVFAYLWASRWRSGWTATVVQSAVAILAVALAAFPAIGRHHSTRGIARQAVAAAADGEPIVSYRFFHHTLHYYTGYRIMSDLQDRRSLEQLLANRGRLLVVTEASRLSELRQVTGVSLEVLAEQSKLRLVRLSPRDGPGGGS
jgi:4-amino-4-deoxy-L-arabinose transferase-like glycosyltransferase